MQGIVLLNAIWYVAPSLIIGYILGHIFGGKNNYTNSERVILMFVVGFFGGLIISLIVGKYTIISTQYLLLGIATFIAAILFGAVMNWTPHIDTRPKTHIVYDFENDDEEFDREIEEALGGS